nr:uncharacterized protein LOC110384388 [Helicoverpa armigera]XP_049696456.1 uncharacterized protein LOC110384388 [Helicoverpa armigera]XP_049696457.1 uncharacterized protein LOC110384388 [Helicoverpa armigera]
MAQKEQLSLSWCGHQKNICSGLSVLQQRGEFVDMTLAADGYHVKVHQMVMSLVSPYIKELISTAQCPHPIIFLNNISYTTLRSILEYVYTGEVLVPKDRLDDLLAAGKALHIKGLREMNNDQPPDPPETHISPQKPTNMCENLKAYRDKKNAKSVENIEAPQPVHEIFLNEDEENGTEQDSLTMETQDNSTDVCDFTMDADISETENKPDSYNRKEIIVAEPPDTARKALMSQKLQYSFSNQGGLQVIHNRFIYHLRYLRKTTRHKFWRCVDYQTMNKCPANITTDDNNQVSKRSFTHNHPFHDNKIMKKIRSGTIYAVYQEAENNAENKKKQRNVPIHISESE